MKPPMWSGTILVATALAVPPAPARQDVAMKDLMPKRMVIGVAVNQRRPKPAFDAVVDALRNAR